MNYADDPKFLGQIRYVWVSVSSSFGSFKLQQAYDRGGPYEILEWRDVPEVKDAPSS